MSRSLRLRFAFVVAVGCLVGDSALAQLTVDRVSPTRISYLGKTEVTITGSGFAIGATRVRFSGVDAAIGTVTATRIVCTAPRYAGGGRLPVAVSVEVTSGREVARLTATYVGPFEADSISPNPVLANRPRQTVTVQGRGFTDVTRVTVNGLDVAGTQLIDGERLSFEAPTLPPGTYDVVLTDTDENPLGPRQVRDTLSLTYASVIELVSFAPAESSFLGKTPFIARGGGFTESTIIDIAGSRVLNTFVDETTLRGVIPPELGDRLDRPLPVSVTDPFNGTAVLPEAITYIGPLSLTSVVPSEFVSGSTATFRLTGVGFTPESTLRLERRAGGSAPVSITPTYLNPRTMQGTAPAAPAPGEYLLRVTDSIPGVGSFTATIPVTYVAAVVPVIERVEPAEACNDGGTFITIYGRNFGEDAEATVDGVPLVDQVVHERGSTITGKAPAFAGVGAAQLVVTDGRGSSSRRDVLTYVDRCSSMRPGPEQIETSLAEGTARFSWYNPVPYSEIHVFDVAGNLLQVLPGRATSIEVDTEGSDNVGLQFKGVMADSGSYSASANAFALAAICEYPPPLDGAVVGGDTDLTVFGGHSPVDVNGCLGGDGGGAALPPPAPHYAQAENGIGNVVPAWVKDLLDGPELVTGFTLDNDADRLEISGYYQKLATDFGLSLRGRIIQVYPTADFEAEFTFPDPFIGDPKDFHSLTFFRTDGDPADPEAVPCLEEDGSIKKVPAGDYLLKIYAVGGNRKLPYYVFGDDPRDKELLIPGVPCPPYPLVRVRDLTGFRSLPNITGVTLENAMFMDFPFQKGVHATFSVSGTWFDENNNQFSINEKCHEVFFKLKPGGGFTSICLDPPYKASPFFEYCWTIHATEPPMCEPGGTTKYTVLPDWGCYKIEVTVTDKGCGVSRTGQEEVAIVPNNKNICQANNPHFSFRYPTPDPSSIYAIGSLKNPTPGNGTFKGQRPFDVRVLVIPRCYCDGDPPSDCAAAQIQDSPGVTPPDLSGPEDDVQFRLAVVEILPGNPIQLAYHDLNAKVRVVDLCPNVVGGPKYFRVIVDDLGEIPWSPHLDGYNFRIVFLQGRTNCERMVSGNGQTTCVAVPPNERTWFNVGKPLRMANHPPSLDVSFWEGSYEEGDSSYHFVTKSSPNTEESFALGDTKGMDFGIVDAGLEPTTNNNMSVGFTSRFMSSGGEWNPEIGSGTSNGQLLDNSISGKPQNVMPTVIGGQGAGAAAGLPAYEWCCKEEIFHNHFSQELFKALIYAGFIGPIPVNIWGSVGLGLGFDVDAYASVCVSPFKALEGPGANFVESNFTIISKVGISIPCQISADILGGIASINLRLVPTAGFELDPYMTATMSSGNQQVIVDHYLEAWMKVDMEAEACVQTLILGEQCLPTITIPLVPKFDLIDKHGSKPQVAGCSASCSSGGAGAGELVEQLDIGLEEDLWVDLDGGDGGGAGKIEVSAYELANKPVSITSPDGKIVVDIWASEETSSKILQVVVTEEGNEHALTTGVPGIGWYFLDPTASFISNDTVILAGTSPPGNFEPDEPPENPDHPQYLPIRNLNAAYTEIHLGRIFKDNGQWQFSVQTGTPVSDQLVTPDQDRRADGKPSIAGDLTLGNGLVAWVRYAGDYLITDGFQPLWFNAFVNTPGGGGAGGIVVGPATFQEFQTPIIRPQMEATSIAVRRVDLDGVIEGEEIVTISEPGINVQPSLALSPSGEVGYCVWVHDPTSQTGHVDLLESNIGRRLRFAVYTRASDTWSAPDDVVVNPDNYPGILGPSIALKDELNGMLAFTAMKAGAAPDDSGLGGGSRFVWASRLVNGVFQPPVLIHGECEDRVYGWGTSMTLNVPTLVDFKDLHLKIRPPEWVMSFQGFGRPGLPDGSGNVMVTCFDESTNTWTPAEPLLEEGTVVSNVAATVVGGAIHSIHHAAGFANVAAAQGAGAGLPPAGIIRTDTQLLPDASIARCELSQNFPGPGARVTATVEVENIGLASTPIDDFGQSPIGLQIVFIAEDGSTRVAARRDVPILGIRQSETFEIALEMPHDPVRVRAVLQPNPLDRSSENDERECFFGAPAPRGLACEDVSRFERDGTIVYAASLSWTNPAIYDQVWLYRDGSALHALPGRCTRFTDTGVRPGEHTYEVRGCIGPSKSTRTTVVCVIEDPEPPGGASFLRGDSNGDLQHNISDASYTLNFLFRGGPAPPCRAAGNTNGDGGYDISDVSYSLNFLFRDGPRPPAPFPTCETSDSEDDERLGCDREGC